MRLQLFSTCRPLTQLLTVVALGVVACDNPAKPIEGAGDPENISRVTISLTPTTSGPALTSVVVDPDGTALPQAPRAPQGTLTLTKGVTYNGAIGLLNDLDAKNIIDIADDVRKEANFHRFFYTTTCAGVTIPDAGLDLDTQKPTAFPVGLKFQVVVASSAASSSNCTLRVQLRHWESVKGNGLGSGFDTDLDLTFPMTIN